MLACSHTPRSHLLKPGVDSRCEACQRPMGVRAVLQVGTKQIRTWRPSFTQIFPLDTTVRVN
jgi:hypothetical protein